ncbi:Hypothetical predicted protein [Olea europaea subsp. europaea]|uniref:Uncharacterized protein n=1 Tax=Olea europaea subsp. europaea TaxID=158383 RepID=A0A8S0S6H4_OLEEU|nr:Hypothetical predicted protein [Olea europaea subsp. europaea]
MQLPPHLKDFTTALCIIFHCGSDGTGGKYLLLLHLNGMTTLHFDDYSLRDSSQRFTPTTLLFVSLSPLRDHHSDTEATSLSPYQRCHHNNDEHRGNSVALPFTATLDVALSFTTVSRAAV